MLVACRLAGLSTLEAYYAGVRARAMRADANLHRCSRRWPRSDASLGPISIPSLGNGVMLGTAWIDRPVDTQGLRSLLPRPPRAAWKRGHAQANDRHSSRVFATPPRGLARTTRNG